MQRKPCYSCNGTGEDYLFKVKPCPKCNGNGFIDEPDDPEDNSRRRTGGPTTRDVITFFVVAGVFVAIIWYIFTR